MTTTLVKARPKGTPAPPKPMTIKEAEASVERINRAVADWTVELVSFYERAGWRILGYPSIRHCLSDRLKIGVDSTLHILRAATTKTQVAALTNDTAERKRVLNLSDHAALRLRRLDDPKRRLVAFREAEAEAGRNGGRVTGALVGSVVRRMTGVRANHIPTADRLKCPRCSGQGWVAR